MKVWDHSCQLGAVLSLPYLGATEEDIEKGMGGGWAIWNCPMSGNWVTEMPWSDTGTYFTEHVGYQTVSAMYCLSRPSLFPAGIIVEPFTTTPLGPVCRSEYLPS